MVIEQINPNELKPYKNNAKIHTEEQVGQIIRSIQEFGFNDPIAVDENNMIIEGHGRQLAAIRLGLFQVPCIRLVGLTDDQKRAYIHVHNQLTMNTGFDLEILEQELQNITTVDMGLFGFDMDFSVDFRPEDFDDGETVSTPEAAAPPRCKRGQLWQLGDHRLLCGDSTDESDVDLLTGGVEMDLCITDPPYNVDYVGKTADSLTIQNDSMDDGSFHLFLYDFYTQMLRALKPGGSYYIFHADSEGLNFRSALQEAGGQVKQNLVWVKNTMVLGRQDYQWKHEPCLYGWKEGAGHYFINDRCQTTVFENRFDLDSMDRDQLLQTAKFLQECLEHSSSTVIHENKPARNALHPTMKPVPLLQRLIQNSSRRGERVLDLFGGSGSTMMACEACGRSAYLMELDPKYCDAAIQRWEDETGRKAVLLNGIE